MLERALMIAATARRWLSSILEAGALVGLLVMAISVILQVVFRYALEVVAPWTEELARFACIWTVFLGAAVCFEEGAHIKIDLIAAKVSRETISRMLLLINIFVTGTFIVIVFYGSILVLKIGWADSATTIPIQMGLVYLALPISVGSMAIFGILRLCEAIGGTNSRSGAAGSSSSR